VRLSGGGVGCRASAVLAVQMILGNTLRSKGLRPGISAVSRVCNPQQAAAGAQHQRWRSTWLCRCRISIYTEAARPHRHDPPRRARSLSPIPSPGGGVEPWGLHHGESSRPLRLAARVNSAFPADTRDSIGSGQIGLPFDGHGGWIKLLPRNGKRGFFISIECPENFTKPAYRPLALGFLRSSRALERGALLQLGTELGPEQGHA